MVMEKKDRHKLCPQCEGNIPMMAMHCPFCGFAQADPSYQNKREFKEVSQSSLSSLYNPPYLAQSIGESRKEREEVQETEEQRETPNQEIEEIEKNLAKKELIIIILLAIGGQFMMLGLILFFFSVDGVVTLQWKSKYWYFYCLFSIPFLLLGLKSLKRLEQKN
jgi:hypothetical protein